MGGGVRPDLDSGKNFNFWGGGGGGVLYQIPEQGCSGEIWSKFSGSLAGWCITDSLSHTTYVETNDNHQMKIFAFALDVKVLIVCLHCLIPISILIPIQIEFGGIVMLRIVYSQLIPMHVLIAMQMGTAPNLVPISVPIRWNLSHFHYYFTMLSLLVSIPV